MNPTESIPELDALVNAARRLPRELVIRVTEFAEALGKQHAASAVDESDAWTDGDLRDWIAASAKEADRFPPAS